MLRKEMLAARKKNADENAERVRAWRDSLMTQYLEVADRYHEHVEHRIREQVLKGWGWASVPIPFQWVSHPEVLGLIRERVHRFDEDLRLLEFNLDRLGRPDSRQPYNFAPHEDLLELCKPPLDYAGQEQLGSVVFVGVDIFEEDEAPESRPGASWSNRISDARHRFQAAVSSPIPWIFLTILSFAWNCNAR